MIVESSANFCVKTHKINGFKLYKYNKYMKKQLINLIIY